MTDRALSEAAMRAGLRDIHLPEAAAGGGMADLAAAVGLAAGAALLAAAILRLLSHRRRRSFAPSPRQRLERARTLPEPERRVALLRLLRDSAPDRYGELTADLYSLAGAPRTAELEAEVAARV